LQNVKRSYADDVLSQLDALGNQFGFYCAFGFIKMQTR
jgi:hypothetical protein